MQNDQPSDVAARFVRLPSIAERKLGHDYVAPVRLDPRILDQMQRTIRELGTQYAETLKAQVGSLFAFIDPQLSVMTDDAVEGKVDEGDFRRAITFISLSRLAGTILAQALLLPAATLIAYVSVHV